MKIKVLLLTLISTALFSYQKPSKQDYLFLDKNQLKQLGIVINKYGLYYKNFNPDWEKNKEAYTCLGIVCNKKHYASNVVFNEKDTVSIDKIFDRLEMSKNDFYPLLVGNINGKINLDNNAIGPDHKLLPIAIKMKDAKSTGRKDTLVFWFKPTETLKKHISKDIQIDKYIRTRPK